MGVNPQGWAKKCARKEKKWVFRGWLQNCSPKRLAVRWLNPNITMFVLVRFSSRDPLLCAHVLASVQGCSSIQLYSPVFVSHNLFVFLRENWSLRSLRCQCVRGMMLLHSRTSPSISMSRDLIIWNDKPIGKDTHEVPSGLNSIFWNMPAERIWEDIRIHLFFSLEGIPSSKT